MRQTWIFSSIDGSRLKDSGGDEKCSRDGRTSELQSTRENTRKLYNCTT